MCTRIIKKGNFLKTYKILKTFYYKQFLKVQFKEIPLSSNFLFFFNKYHSFRDLDRVLFWKYNQLDSMFSYKTKFFKKQKKQTSSLIFITGIKRVLVCMNFLKYLILLKTQRKKKNMTPRLFTPLFNYIAYDKTNSVVKIKYKIYKQKLMQLQV